MSLPSHRLPPPVSQTVGGSAAAAAAAAGQEQQLTDVTSIADNSSVGDRHRQAAKVPRHTGHGTSAATTVVEPVSFTAANRSMQLPSKQDSVSTIKTTDVADDLKQTGSDIGRPMRPQSVLKSYMKYLTPYEHQEIFNYSTVSLCLGRPPGQG